MAQDKEKKVSFQYTLNLPRTEFPIRANTKINDPEMLKRWEKEDLFSSSFYHNDGKEKFILHDGPPYANGNLHIGHAYNKILKDMVTKAQRMQDKHVPVTPGWDCHGLPIELKVSKEQEGKNLSRSEFKKECRAYAQKWIDIQKDEFKQLGVLMDWENPYLTMNFGYESSIMRAFGTLVEDEYIERKNKTVPWCASCETVLAIAEIEYKERKDPSIYVTFPLTEQAVQAALPELVGQAVSLLIWTTTPWTLPLNRAVLLKPDSKYVVLDINGKRIIVGESLADALCEKVGVDKKIVATFTSNKLTDAKAHAHHPFVDGLTVPIILSENVLLGEGTACVHCAPGCGPEDYEVGVKNNLKIFGPVGPDGKYQTGIAPKELEGMPVKDGQIWVIKKLVEKDHLLYKTSLRHSYPHCWRCHNGLIFRATKQWFCDLSKNNLKDKAINALKKVKTFPEKSINRLAASIGGRLEWCLSRQRVWGVPIPALLCKDCDHTYISKELADKVADNIQKEGVEYWDTVSVETLVGAGFTCPSCNSSNMVKETDILDVWFDSGVSHYAVLSTNKNLAFPANIYLEGKDQHRGWFQSSLLTSVIMNNIAPMKNLLTHGFTVDEKGHKMSKSVGNVVSPQEMIDKLGTDGLRLWVSSIDYTDDAVVSDVLLKNVSQVFRKVRNTCRFLLSNLYDFDKEKDAVTLDRLPMIDQYALHKLTLFSNEVQNAYNDYDFTAVFHAFADYASSELSSFYLDIIKDRLYVEQADGFKRRSAQTAVWYILDTLTKLMAPILSFTAEQVSDYYQKDKKESIHLQNFASQKEIVNALKVDDNVWKKLREVRSAILKGIEELREQKIIKHSLEAAVTLYIDTKQQDLIPLKKYFDAWSYKDQSAEEFLKEFLIVSDFKLEFPRETIPQIPSDITPFALRGDLRPSDRAGIYLKVEKAAGEKCPRCWHWQPTDHEHNLCARCQKITGK